MAFVQLSSLLLATFAASTVAVDVFTNVTIYTSPNNTGATSYARTEELPDGSWIATWNSFGDRSNSSILSSLPVYRSTDEGHTWGPWGKVGSGIPGRRLVQPHLLVLTEDMGEYEEGTVLLAVNAADNNSTNIEIYASEDLGENWKFATRVAVGGRGNTTNGATPVWEPFLLLHNHKLICYYSDQRDPKHGQKLAHQTTRDLVKWGPVVNDVAEKEYTDRPGMQTVTQLPNGKWVVSFEYAMLNGTNTTTDYIFPVHIRIADDPEKFDGSPSIPVKSPGAPTRPDAAPYVVWSPVGGENGTLVLSDNDNSVVFINQKLGLGEWQWLETGASNAYSRELRIPKDDTSKLWITAGGRYGAKAPTKVEITILDLEEALEKKNFTTHRSVRSPRVKLPDVTI
ncbi:hypothetical protein BCR34DRAFT_491366 [Clohesyomyces aquaticus]|uniref:Glycoside hydrolase family 93 protein n=1 Tax=Clohesyomyces aquaticus TaxID=1231657 RepID=A0A1Y1Z3V9_9PLEO|nr:hypothetical protein BCR34DRAFT_491366 [Clohesyomyces aquaticus]